MAQPIAKYPGGIVTCYPGSNQTDDGKLNEEFNMARFVTRVSSKNFCIVNPSFNLTAVQESGANKIQVGIGQASINGMDLIMTGILTIDPPEQPGKYHLAFKLARDSSNNVLGDLIYGVTTTFEGVYLSYYTEKPDPMDPDMLFLGSLNWDGKTFTDIVEDEDKYGRLWAEDIMCKMNDPKHPDDTRLNLQEWLDKVPDRYFSKEGDTIYGPLIMSDNRNDNNPGILQNVDETGSHLTVKDPEKDNSKLQFYGDVNRDGTITQADYDLVEKFVKGTATPNALQKHLADVNHDGVIDEKDLLYILNFINKEGNSGDTGNIYYIDDNTNDFNVDVSDDNVKVSIGKGSISQNTQDGDLHIHNDGNICMDAEGDMKLEADGKITLGTEKADSPKLELNDTGMSLKDSTAPDLEFSVKVTDGNTIQQTLGKAIWQYDNTTKNVTLLQNNVNFLDVTPNGIYRQNLNVVNTLYLGSATNNSKTYLKQLEWRLANAANTVFTQFLPQSIIITDNTEDEGLISVKNTADTTHTKLFNSGKIELYNNTKAVQILWKDGTASYDVTLEKIYHEKRLNLQGNLSVTNDIICNGSITGNGLITSNGTLTFKNGTNDATIKKDTNNTNLRTSNNLYVGSSGTGQLFAGNTVVNGTLGVGGSTYANSEFQVDAAGNVKTSGTITGSKVFNAVYNDGIEFMEKENYNENIKPGDVVFFTDNGKVTKYNDNINIKSIAGIVSSEETYGWALGGEGLKDNEKVPVALFGRVYLNVDIDVNTGDLLAVNRDGKIVVSEDKNRYVVGLATKSSSNGKVLVKVI